MKNLQWDMYSDNSGAWARGLKYYYKIDFEKKQLDICQKWLKGYVDNYIIGDVSELESFANKHNADIIQKEIDYHKNQLKTLKKQWEAE